MGNKRLCERINGLLSSKKYDEEYNKEIINVCQICRKISGTVVQKENLGSPTIAKKFKSTSPPPPPPPVGIPSIPINCKELILDEAHVLFDPMYLIEVQPGNFQQILAVRHGDHLDFLPASYIYSINPSLIKQ